MRDRDHQKLLYLSTEDWAFCQHFLIMARAARDAGLKIAVAARMRAHRALIENEGFASHNLEVERRSLGPVDAALTVKQMLAIIQTERPDIVHCIGLRMVVLGGCAARFAGVKRIVLAPTGLGHLWIQNGLIDRALREIVRLFVGSILNSDRTHYLFENPDDAAEFGLKPGVGRVMLVNGAGVDAADFPPAPDLPAPPVRAAVVARMVRPKGIVEAVGAIELARAGGANIELHLFGEPDPSNRTSLTAKELAELSTRPGIFWHGLNNDIAGIWREHHIAMLLSYREGLPRSLVESAAASRPIVTTDVPGCREVIRDGIEGFLVPNGDIAQTAARLAQLANDPGLRVQMGEAANRRFRERFSSDAVSATMQAFYRRICGEITD